MQDMDVGVVELEGPPAPRLITKTQLARECGLNDRIITDILFEHPDFPVVTKGVDGKWWKFDADVAIAEVKRIRGAGPQPRGRMAAEGESGRGAPVDRTLSPGQQLAAIKVERERRKMEVEERELIPRGPLEEALRRGNAALAKAMLSIVAELGDEFDLPEAVRRRWRNRTEQALRDRAAGLRAADLPVDADAG